MRSPGERCAPRTAFSIQGTVSSIDSAVGGTQGGVGHRPPNRTIDLEGPAAGWQSACSVLLLRNLADHPAKKFQTVNSDAFADCVHVGRSVSQAERLKLTGRAI